MTVICMNEIYQFHVKISETSTQLLDSKTKVKGSKSLSNDEFTAFSSKDNFKELSKFLSVTKMTQVKRANCGSSN